MLAIFPALLSAQDIQLPTIEIRASQDKVPLMVKEAVLSDFGESHKPMVWVTDNSLFKRGEWEQITNIEDIRSQANDVFLLLRSYFHVEILLHSEVESGQPWVSSAITLSIFPFSF